MDPASVLNCSARACLDSWIGRPGLGLARPEGGVVAMRFGLESWQMGRAACTVAVVDLAGSKVGTRVSEVRKRSFQVRRRCSYFDLELWVVEACRTFYIQIQVVF